MRIPSGVTDQYIYFVAVDAIDLNTRETGLTTFTVWRSRNGGVAAAMTTPTINETSAANMPGDYELLLDEDMTIDAGDDEQEMIFHITHAGMAPVTRAITLFRPKITVGETVTASGGNANAAVQSMAAAVLTASAIATDAITAAKIAANAIGASEFAQAAADKVWATVLTEPAGVPAWAGNMGNALNWLLGLNRNKVTQTATTQTLRNDADLASIATAAVSDDGTTFTRGEWV